MDIVKTIIEFSFGSALFVNALLFIPQIIKIFKEKTARGVSLLTFAGFLLIQLAVVLHGIINHDYLLIIGYLLSMVTCGLVVLLALIYKPLKEEISYEEILNQLPGHIYWKNKDGVYWGCNRQTWFDFDRKNLADFVGKTNHEMYPKEIADKFRTDDEEVMRTGEIKVFEEPAIVNNKEVLFLSHKKPLRNKHNEIIGIIGTSVDITASKQETLNQLKALENIIAIMPGHIYWMDKNGTYLGCNDNQAKAIGFTSRQEIIGKHNIDMRGYLTQEFLSSINKINHEVMENGKTVIVEEPALLDDGGEGIFLSMKAPLRNHSREIIGMVGISVDITDRKRAESLKLENELQRIKLQDQENFRKIADQVVHDIRSPLASLLMIVKSCEKNIPEQARTVLREAAIGIGDIANNLLDKYKIEHAGVFAPEKKQPIPVFLVLLQILSEKKHQYKELPVKFNYSSCSGCNFIFIDVEPIAFKRMMSNIINNAVEALDKQNGKVCLKLDVIDKQVKIIVNDNGKGMPQEIIDKIMNNIAVTSGKEHGSGIGFTQIYETLQRNQGILEIDSKINSGTKITLTFAKVNNPDWIAKQIVLNKNDTVVVLDDDNSIHGAWNVRFKDHEKDIHIKHFTSGEETISFINKFPKKEEIFLLADFELLKQELSGLHVIGKTGIKRAILVTSHYANNIVLELATKNGIKLLPKQLASEIPIIIDMNKNPEKSKKVDLVLIDDNKTFADSLTLLFEGKNKIVDKYYDPTHFLKAVSQYAKDTKIFLDHDFKNSISGFELAEQLHKKGYTNLYLLSGSDFNKEKIPSYLIAISKTDTERLYQLADNHI